MSKFIDALHAKLTGRRYPILEPLSVTAREVTDEMDFRTTDEYEFTVVWKIRGHCQREDFKAMQENVFRELQEAVYGDLRSRVLQIERAVYEQDREKLLTHTRDLLVEVTGR